MPELFKMKLAAMQPSQLFISAEKLRRVQEEFNPAKPETLRPIPVKYLDGQIVMMDGHTRAFAAHQAGLKEVKAYWDPDELDLEAYEICVRWCRDAGIYSVADLQGRVVGKEEYERLWEQRCTQMHQELHMRPHGTGRTGG